MRRHNRAAGNREAITFALALIAAASGLELRAAELEELPAVLADRLEPQARTGWLTGQPSTLPSTCGVVPTPKPPRCWSKTYSTVLVLYPRTHCVLRDQLGGILTQHELDSVAAGAQPATASVHRLTRLRDVAVSPELYCVTRSGPWLGEILRDQQCSGAITYFLAPYGGGNNFPAAVWFENGGPPAELQFASSIVPQPERDEGGACAGSLSECAIP